MRKIRVLVANRPRLMRDLILAVVSEQSDIEVVGEIESEAAITELVEQTRPDCLIISLEAQRRPELCGFLLGRYPTMKVLEVGADRDSTVLYWAFVDIRSQQIENSEHGILAALRSSAVSGDVSSEMPQAPQ